MKIRIESPGFNQMQILQRSDQPVARHTSRRDMGEIAETLGDRLADDRPTKPLLLQGHLYFRDAFLWCEDEQRDRPPAQLLQSGLGLERRQAELQEIRKRGAVRNDHTDNGPPPVQFSEIPAPRLRQLVFEDAPHELK